MDKTIITKAAHHEFNSHDPVRLQSAPPETGPVTFCPGKGRSLGRKPLTAEQRHQVHVRDQGRCTFVNPQTTERCANDRWLHTHHIVSVREGGSNHAENLTTLCAAHHDLVHQLSLPIDGQVTWLREPQVMYS